MGYKKIPPDSKKRTPLSWRDSYANTKGEIMDREVWDPHFQPEDMPKEELPVFPKAPKIPKWHQHPEQEKIWEAEQEAKRQKEIRRKKSIAAGGANEESDNDAADDDDDANDGDGDNGANGGNGGTSEYDEHEDENNESELEGDGDADSDDESAYEDDRGAEKTHEQERREQTAIDQQIQTDHELAMKLLGSDHGLRGRSSRGQPTQANTSMAQAARPAVSKPKPKPRPKKTQQSVSKTQASRQQGAITKGRKQHPNASASLAKVRKSTDGSHSVQQIVDSPPKNILHEKSAGEGEIHHAGSTISQKSSPSLDELFAEEEETDEYGNNTQKSTGPALKLLNQSPVKTTPTSVNTDEKTLKQTRSPDEAQHSSSASSEQGGVQTSKPAVGGHSDYLSKRKTTVGNPSPPAQSHVATAPSALSTIANINEPNSLHPSSHSPSTEVIPDKAVSKRGFEMKLMADYERHNSVAQKRVDSANNRRRAHHPNR